jgi:hypothetical protein
MNDEELTREAYQEMFYTDMPPLKYPHSSVFYVRAAIEARTGITYDLEHVESSMRLEGWRD